jgi:hypothetical protein
MLQEGRAVPAALLRIERVQGYSCTVLQSVIIGSWSSTPVCGIQQLSVVTSTFEIIHRDRRRLLPMFLPICTCPHIDLQEPAVPGWHASWCLESCSATRDALICNFTV